MTLRRFELITWKDYQSVPKGPEQRLLVSSAPYTTPYKTKGRGEWLIISEEWTGHLECKHQECSGSVDEKLPYVFERVKCSNHPDFCLVLSGKFWVKSTRGHSAATWARDKAQACPIEICKRVVVLIGTEEVMEWIKETWS